MAPSPSRRTAPSLSASGILVTVACQVLGCPNQKSYR